MLRSCRATGRWWLGRGRGRRERGLGVSGWRCGRVGGAGRRLGAVRRSISWPRRGWRSRGDVHPSHLVSDLLHWGWGPIVVGKGGLWP